MLGLKEPKKKLEKNVRSGDDDFEDIDTDFMEALKLFVEVGKTSRAGNAVKDCQRCLNKKFAVATSVVLNESH